jgi:hypothetical protein
VAVGSYSNFHINLFVSTGHSRGFSHNDGVREPAYQHDLARDYIASNFTAMGYDTWLDPFGFEYSNTNGTYTYTNCNNVVAVKPGAGGTNVYIIGAHYDTVDVGQTDAWVTNLCPGADDNASGVAAMLEIARVMQDYTFRETIYFIAFDAEEKEFSGSRHFANTHTTGSATETNATNILRSRIKGMVSVDMIAYNKDETPDQVIIGSPVASTGQISYDLEQACTNHTGMQPLLMHLPGSDHNAFEEVGIDAALVIEGDFLDYTQNPPLGNIHMHRDSDALETPGLISYRYAADVTKCVAGYVCEQAGVIPPATLQVQGVSDDKVELFFHPTAGVSYNLYGTTNLLMTNAWEFIQPIPVTNPAAGVAIELDVDGASERMYKVVGE